jgi:putative transposase
MIYKDDCTLPKEYLEQLTEEGLESLPEMIRLLVNQAMQIERDKHLNVKPYERSDERNGHANGYKPKTVKTRVGEVTFEIPQVREGGFYPEALEKGLRSERALVLALAEMYVQGVSTRKVAAITERLCGTQVSATQVSRAAEQLDETLDAWRTRPLGEVAYQCAGCGYSDGQWCKKGWEKVNIGHFRISERRTRALAHISGGFGQTRSDGS